jgi:hypothetical protein
VALEQAKRGQVEPLFPDKMKAKAAPLAKSISS